MVKYALSYSYIIMEMLLCCNISAGCNENDGTVHWWPFSVA